MHYLVLMRFDKPTGIYLLLWPAMWALWIAAEGNPSTWLTVVFVGGVILMRAAGCVINDFADREIDDQVERTKFRPLAMGLVSSAGALTLFILLSLAAFALVWTTNWLTIALSGVAIILAVIYPFMKRHTFIPQAFLGLAFGWAVPMAFAAQTGSIPIVAWLMLIATVLWATAYDTMYAMIDREDDLRIGVKSTAILFGDADKVIIAMIQGTFFLTMLIVGHRLQVDGPYYIGITVAAGFAGYQQFLIRERDTDRCLRAFMNNNLLGATIFLGIVAEYVDFSKFTLPG
ncbi:MAG: 4-hydroxybenzoate octaprenyltransferase [Thiohalomonadales bacterium]